MHQAGRRLRFATTRLATGLKVHDAEQGDPGGETIVLLPADADAVAFLDATGIERATLVGH